MKLKYTLWLEIDENLDPKTDPLSTLCLFLDEEVSEALGTVREKMGIPELTIVDTSLKIVEEKVHVLCQMTDEPGGEECGVRIEVVGGVVPSRCANGHTLDEDEKRAIREFVLRIR